MKKTLLLPTLFILLGCSKNITVDELKEIALKVKENITSEDFTYPTVIKLHNIRHVEMKGTSGTSFKIDYEYDLSYNKEKGYFYFKMDEGDDDESYYQEGYIYVDGNNCYAATQKLDGRKVYDVIETESKEEAIETAIQLIQEEGLEEMIYKHLIDPIGIDTLIDTIDTYKLNNDDDASNDNNGSYVNYNTTIEAKSKNEESFDVITNTNADKPSDDATLYFSYYTELEYKDSLLVKDVETVDMHVKASEDEEPTESIKSNIEYHYEYKFKLAYPNIEDYTFEDIM